MKSQEERKLIIFFYLIKYDTMMVKQIVICCIRRKKYKKRVLKITSIVLGVLVGIVVLDTLQAKVFDNSPLIKIRKNFKDGYVQYMDKGIFVNHYHCGNNEEKTTWKRTKYACPIKGVNF